MIEVRVYANIQAFGKHDPALVRRIEYEGMKVPYDHLVEAFRCLFGSECVVDFIVTL